MTTFGLAGDDVVREVFDGEVVIIHMGTGKYYSTNPLGGEIWAWLENGHPLEHILQALQAHFSDRAEVADDLNAFVSDVQLQQLMQPQPANAPSEAIQVQLTAYEAPKLRIYDDLQQILGLDPIHDVDETGWPQAAPV